MAWLSSTAWSTSDTPVLATVLNNIGLDIRTWGANVDAAGYDILNVRQITGASGKLGVGTPSAAFGLHVNVGDNAVPSTAGAMNGTAFFGNPSTTYGLNVGVIGATGASWLQSRANSTANATLALNPNGGYVGIGTVSPTAPLHVAGLPAYASNAAAITGGLTAGAFYRNGDTVCVVH